MSMPKIEIPTIFELQTEKYGTLKVGNLRFGGVMKLVEAFPDLKNPSPRKFCTTFASLVVKREDGEELIDADLLTEKELESFAVQYLENDKELFRRNDKTIEKLKTATESNIEYFTRVATDYLISWSEKFSNGAISKVLKASASLRTLTSFGVPQGLVTIAKAHKSLSSLPAFPVKGKVEPVPVVMKSPLEGIDFSSIRSPAQESNEHLARIVEHLEALPLKITQDSSPQLTSMMEQLQKIVDQGEGTASQNVTMIKLSQGMLLAAALSVIVGVVSGWISYQVGKNSSPHTQASASAPFKQATSAVSPVPVKSPVQKPISTTQHKKTVRVEKAIRSSEGK